MSFFNSLQQYVSSGVANLSLSPKRFSLSRDNSSGGNYADISPSEHINASSGRSASTGNVIATGSNSTVHGFPKVVPPPGTTSPFPRVRRRTIECPPGSGSLDVPTTPRRVGSFRHQRPVRTPLMFCRRRQSWPEFDQQATSGVQETDGSFFESFTALSWKQENRRLLIQQEIEMRSGDPPSPPSRQSDARISNRDLEQLYVEVLYTIKNKVGVSTGQYAHYQEELYQYAQEAFNIPPQRHRRLLAIASEEKPPIVVLNVVVVEAENLEAKDANGFSDPYCMLGIQPGNAAPPSPQPLRETPPLSPRMPASRALSDSGSDLESPKHESSHHEKLRKHHSFRLSFKRRDTISGRREGRDSISCAVPAKFIRATSVRPQTLNPRWNEKFRFDIDDVSSDILHLDIWDHDDESSVLDAVSRLNEVRGVKGLGRFFKQIAQSARSGSADDFLGCVNIPLQDIPSTGLEGWYKLEARTTRSNIQGRIKLKLWFSTREDRGTSEEDNWTEIHQQEQLYAVFIGYELSKHRGRSWEWGGDLPHVALTILHQHAIQGDVTDLQLALVRWVAYARISQERSLDPRILHKLLQELDQVWGTETLSKDEEECLAESFTSFVEHSLYLVRRHRILFPPQQRATMARFDYLLRCLGLLANMKAFWKCCPFHKEIRGEIILALKKGTAEWYEECQAEALNQQDSRDLTIIQSEASKVDHVLQALTHLVTVLLVDLQTGIQAFNPLFEHTNNVPYFNAVYKQLEKMINHDMGPRVAQLCASFRTDESQLMSPNLQIGTPVFELYFALQEFVNMKEHLPGMDQKAVSINCYYQWFEPAVDQWLNVAKVRALYRIKAAFELNRLVIGERIVKHSTSAVDATACFFQIQEFWRQLFWPDLISAYNFVMKIIDIITFSSLYYTDLVQQKLQDSGYYEDMGPFKISDEMCVSVNDLEYVRRSLTMLGTTLSVEPILEAVESTNGEGASQWREALYGALEETRLTLEARALQVISRVGIKMRQSLKKAMFHLAWSPDSLPTAEAISPLLELLDGHLVSLNAALLPRNFERVLADIWDTVLLELGHQVDSTSGEKVAVFYDRLYEALEILVDFFHAEEKGLALESLKSPTYWQVEQRLTYHRTDTDKLISKFYQQRLIDQLNQETSEYGTLSVRAYFNHDSLCVEVLNARDVIPLDPNGFSDPFVIIELLPRKVFAHCAEQQTNVHKKTLNPMFDECFEFSVTLEQCKSEGAMILFTVMDHDVLTSNDFAGEAFLNLNTIPGVADNSSSIDNFHGLKTQDLNLMHQKNRNHPILQILETRTWDRVAQDFVKKQKLRFATNS